MSPFGGLRVFRAWEAWRAASSAQRRSIWSLPACCTASALVSAQAQRQLPPGPRWPAQAASCCAPSIKAACCSQGPPHLPSRRVPPFVRARPRPAHHREQFNPASSSIPSNTGRGANSNSGAHQSAALRSASAAASVPPCKQEICCTSGVPRDAPTSAGKSTTPSGACWPAPINRSSRLQGIATLPCSGHATLCRHRPLHGRRPCSSANPISHPRLNAARIATWDCCTCSAFPACTSGSGAASSVGFCPERRAPCAGPCWSCLPRSPSSRRQSRALPWPWPSAMPARCGAWQSLPGASGLPRSSSKRCVTRLHRWVSSCRTQPLQDCCCPCPCVRAPGKAAL